jgi:ATP-binding cassette subfamily B protein
MRKPPDPRQAIQMLAQLRRAFVFVWRCAPGWTLIGLVLVIVQGALPIVALALLKRIVDAVTAAVGSPDPKAAFLRIMIWIAASGVVALLIAICRSLSEISGEAQTQIVTDAVYDALHTQSTAVDLEYYEDPRYHDTLHRAQQEAPYRPTRIVNGLMQVVQNGVSLVGVAGLLARSNWLLSLLLVVAALPGLFVRVRCGFKWYSFQQEHAEAERQAWYYNWLMTNAECAKEIRLLDIGSILRGRHDAVRTLLREGRLKLSRYRGLMELAAQSSATIVGAGVLAVISWWTVSGTLTVGGLVMYYQGFQLGLSTLQGVLRGIAGLHEDSLFLTDYYEFLTLEPRVIPPAEPVPVPQPIREGISFEQLSFTYPGRAEEILHGLDLTIHMGEITALVGENGAGKTTLVKLLCRLYDPTEGHITVDGVDLKQLDPRAWRRAISVLPQDYLRYFMSARDNIWVGDVALECENTSVEAAARLAGADRVIQRLPNAYDTTLGYGFEDAYPLSQGQWQKVALARTLFRDTQVLVLDEPTSSLDPLAEAEVCERLRDLAQGRSVILISHRLSSVRMADSIYVIRDGAVVEQGAHDELVARVGEYARLYRSQANRYQEIANGEESTEAEG